MPAVAFDAFLRLGEGLLACGEIALERVQGLKAAGERLLLLGQVGSGRRQLALNGFHPGGGQLALIRSHLPFPAQSELHPRDCPLPLVDLAAAGVKRCLLLDESTLLRRETGLRGGELPRSGFRARCSQLALAGERFPLAAQSLLRPRERRLAASRSSFSRRQCVRLPARVLLAAVELALGLLDAPGSDLALAREGLPRVTKIVFGASERG
ncbi:MAG: hypothetical protein M3327_12080, partial [Actinomycetota bacterium]|nr:hypothetical protein [Actinomycetota bacterium]